MILFQVEHNTIEILSNSTAWKLMKNTNQNQLSIGLIQLAVLANIT